MGESLDYPHPVKFAHQAMGTTFEIWISGHEETYSGQAAQAVFSEIDRLENLFSRLNPSSEICQINQLKSGDSLRVSIDVFECLVRAENIRALTKGAFDVNYGKPSNPGESPLGLYRIPNAFMVEVSDKETNTKNRLLDLDLGGIGKGYALDKSLEIMADWEVERALLHGGTSTALAIGDPLDSSAGMGWPVGVTGNWSCPHAPRIFRLKNQALSGSGTEVKGQHILDPRTGLAASAHLAAWTSHPTAAAADALSTAFMVMPYTEVEALCRNHTEIGALVIVDENTFKSYNFSA